MKWKGGECWLVENGAAVTCDALTHALVART